MAEVNKADACALILEGGIMSRKEVEKFQKDMAKWTPEQMESNLEQIQRRLDQDIEQGIDKKLQQVRDLVNVEELVSKMTKDPFTGETLKSLSDVIRNRLEGLVGRNSVDTRNRALKSNLKAYIDETERIFDCASNKTYKSLREIPAGSDAERELYKRVESYETSIDPDSLTPEKVRNLIQGQDDIGKLALSMVTYNEYVRKTMGKYGVSVKFNKNYVMKRRYDWAAAEKMGPEKFGQFLSEKLDLERTFGKGTTPAKAQLMLRDMWEQMRITNSDQISVTADKSFRPDRANSLERSFVYKDPDSSYDAFNQLSLGGMREQFERNATSNAITATSISEFGYDSAKVLANVDARLSQMYKDKPGIMDAWRGERIKQAEIELTGRTSQVQGEITNFASNTRFLMAFAKLGNAVTGTILDVVDNGRQAFYVNGDVFGGFGDFGAAMTKVTFGMSKEERLEVASQLGIALNHISTAEAMRLSDGSVGVGGGRLTQWIAEHGNKAMNIATLLPAQTSRSKVATGLVGAQQFTKLMDAYTSGNMNKFQLDTLKEYGFNKNELAALTSNMIERTENWTSAPIFTANGIRNSLLKGADEAHVNKVAQLLGVKPEAAGRAVLDLATKYESFLNDFVVRGTPTPELATKTAMFKGVNSEILRAGINLGTQFLDTPIAQLGHVKELYDKLHRVNGSHLGAIQNALPHAATYLSVALPAYFAADYAMSLVVNRESLVDKLRNGDASMRRRVLMNAMGRSGLMPFLFEVGEAQFGGSGGPYSKTALDTFGSPALSTAKDILRFAQPEDAGGIGLKEFALRQGPTNSLPLRALNNWSDAAIGEKLWQTKENTRFNQQGQ